MNTPYYLPAEVDRIATYPESVLRNLRITQSYHELSAQLAHRCGLCANWCTFATWASKQAGNSIRQEDLSRALDRIFHEVPEVKTTISELVDMLRRKYPEKDANDIRQIIRDLFSPAAAQQRAGEAVARGNQKVYAEIGRAFAQFLDICGSDTSYNEANIQRFCDALRPGDPPDGQGYLRRAFSRYYRAFFAPDGPEKAQWILLSNLEIGFHEQTRLQPEIAEALDAALVPPDVIVRKLLAALLPYRGWLAYAGWVIMDWLGQQTELDQAINQLLSRVHRLIRLALTRHMMTLGFPGSVTLQLGSDLNAAFPENLRTLSDPELTALLVRIDPTPNDLRGTGATDWADLPERLHFIADLFRCSQENGQLLEPPFVEKNVAEIKNGILTNKDW